MADEVVFKESLMDDRYEHIASDREILWVNDTSGPSYSGQIVIDTSLLTNSGKYLDWANAYIEIPYQVICEPGATAFTNANPWMFGIKNGYFQLIHSMTVEMDGKNIVQQTPFLNIFSSYKVLSTWSSGELQKYGASLGVAPDSPAFRYTSTAGNNLGIGYQNNLIYSTLNSGGYSSSNCLGIISSPSPFNDGYLQRLSLNSYTPIVTEASVPTYGSNLGILNSTARASQCGKNYVSIFNANVILNMVATIRLKDICDAFKVMPLNKSTMRITINYNGGTFNFQNSGGATNGISKLCTVTQTYGGTFPFMLSSVVAGNPLDGTMTASGGGGYNLRCGINLSGTNPILSVSRLYCPAYSLNPSYEIKLIEEMPIKTIRYYDLLNYNFTLASGSTANQLLFNSVVNPQFLLVCPMLTDSEIGASAIKGYQNPFSSEGGSTAPFACLSNFNVQVAGFNVFQSFEQYDWEQYMNETAQFNALNGGMISELTSGLLSQKLWDGANRFYIVDLRRAKPESAKTGKSVLLQCLNNTAKSLDLICFVGYQREISVRTEDGSVTLL